MNLRRLSFLTTIALSALAFVFSAPSASAASNETIGVLHVRPNTNAKVGGQPVSEGAEIHEGDLVQTGGDSAVISFTSGQCALLYANTLARVYQSGHDVSVVINIIRGGFRLLHDLSHRHNDNDNDWGLNGNLPDGLEGRADSDYSGPYFSSFLPGNVSAGGGGGNGRGRGTPVLSAAQALILQATPGLTETRVLPGGQIGLYLLNPLTLLGILP